MKRFFSAFSALSVLFIVLCCLSVFSCRKDRNIYFDESEPLSLAPDVSWALVTEPYVAFRKENGWQSEVEGHARKGDILMVSGKSFSGDESWFRFDQGWLPENSIMVYSNRYKAEKAKSELR